MNDMPANAHASGSSWACNTGYTKSGNSCTKEKVSTKVTTTSSAVTIPDYIEADTMEKICKNIKCHPSVRNAYLMYFPSTVDHKAFVIKITGEGSFSYDEGAPLPTKITSIISFGIGTSNKLKNEKKEMICGC